METGVVVAVSVVLVVAVVAVLICIFATVGTVSGIKHTNDEDTDACSGEPDLVQAVADGLSD